MRWIRFCVDKPYAVIVAVLLAVLFGVLSVTRIPVQLIPTTDRPVVTVDVPYRGAAPQEVEDEITRPVEERLNSVENLREITSTSREGSASISLEFDWGTDKDVATIDILKKLNLVEDLPDDADEPIVSSVSSDEDNPIMWVIATSSLKVNELFEIADDVIQPRLERSPGVGSVGVFGGEERELRVILDPERLAARSLTPTDVVRTLARQNRNVRAGHIEEGKRHITIRTTGQLESIEEVERVILRREGTATVRVSDVGSVVMGYKDPQFYVRQSGAPSLAMPVRRKTGTNTLEVARGVQEAIDELNGSLEGRPGDIRVKAVYDESTYIVDSIQNVVRNLVLGGLLAGGVLIIFLRDPRSTVLAGIAIPICIIATFLALYSFGRSVNLISLAGLAFAGGMVVDNCVVVLENIVRRIQEGEAVATAALEGAAEVWAPLLASTLTTLAVFLPIVFVEEEAGQLFRDIALTISFAVALSLVVALSVVPMGAARIFSARALAHEGDDATPVGGLRGRMHALSVALTHLGVGAADRIVALTRWLMERGVRRWGFVASVVVVFVASVWRLPPAEYLPTGGRNMVLMLPKLAVGTNLERADEIAHQLEDMVRAAVPEMDRYFIVVRRGNPVMGVILKEEFSDRVAEVQGRLWGVTSKLSGAQVIVVRPSIFGRGASSGSTVEITLRGPSLEELSAYADRVTDALNGAPGFLQVRSSFDLGNPELHVVLNRERIADLGLSIEDVAGYVEIVTEGVIASQYRAGGEEVDLTVKGSYGAVGTQESFGNVLVHLPGRTPIHLGEIARLERTLGPVQIEHDELERAIRLSAYVEEGIALESAIARADDLILDQLRAEMPLGYDVKLSGTASDLARTRSALAGSFAVALLVIYLLLVALFESFAYPLVIMLTVPLAITGGLLGVLLSGSTLSVITMLGFVILAGVVVNNSILLVDRALARARAGDGPTEAVLDAVRVRMRPIFMSTTTSILGMLPLALGAGAGSELYRGLGWAVVGGLAFSTVFTLVLTPVLIERFLARRAPAASQ